MKRVVTSQQDAKIIYEKSIWITSEAGDGKFLALTLKSYEGLHCQCWFVLDKDNFGNISHLIYKLFKSDKNNEEMR